MGRAVDSYWDSKVNDKREEECTPSSEHADEQKGRGICRLDKITRDGEKSRDRVKTWDKD